MISKKLILVVVLSLLGLLTLDAKSRPKAMLMSALVPGAGEIYAGDLNRGVFFLTADLAIIYSIYRFDTEIDQLKSNYKQFAYTKAGIPKNRNADYYELIQRWQSSAEYNAYCEMVARNYFLIINNDPEGYNQYMASHQYEGNMAWNWQTERDWTTYKYIRRDHNSMEMNRKLAIGAVIANRVISAIDAAYVTRTKSKKVRPSFTLIPNEHLIGASLNCQLEF